MNPWLVRSRRVRLTRVEQALTGAVHALGATQVGGDGVGPVCRGAHRPDERTDGRERLVDDATMLLRATEWLAPVRRIARTRSELAAAVHAPVLVDERTAELESVARRRRRLGRLGRLGLDQRPMTVADPVDLLTATTEDVAELVHGVAHTTGLGRHRTPDLLDPDEVELALAAALDADDLELIAQVLWLWPMLGLAWNAPARLAMRVLDESYAEVRSSPSASLAHGILGAAILRHPFPRAPRPAPGRPGEPSGSAPRWESSRGRSDPLETQALAPFLLVLHLRRACVSDDVTAVRVTLDLIRAADLADQPAVLQATAWLRRQDAREGRVAHAC